MATADIATVTARRARCTFIHSFIYLPIKQRDKSVNGIQVGRTETQRELLL